MAVAARCDSFSHGGRLCASFQGDGSSQRSHSQRALMAPCVLDTGRGLQKLRWVKRCYVSPTGEETSGGRPGCSSQSGAEPGSEPAALTLEPWL